MARFDPILTNFNSGELSKLLIGRVDIAKYANGVDTLENFLIMLQGGITRKPGTRYVATTKDSGVARLIPFQYSADQDYVMEMGDEYIRLFSNEAAALTEVTYNPFLQLAKLLLHCNGDDESVNIIDETGKTIIVQGTAELDTAAKKWGTASLLLDGAAGNLRIADSPDFSIVTNFTVDLFVKHDDHAGTETYAAHYVNAANYFTFDHVHGTGLRGLLRIENVEKWTIQGGEIADTNWHHIALIKVGSDIGIYKDGVQVAYKSASDTANFAAYFDIGTVNSTNYFDGHMDEIRIYQSNVFGAVPNVGLTNTITVPTTETPLVESSEIDSPYVEDDIFEVQQSHKGDIKYMTHGDYFPRKLSRIGAASFLIELADIKRGPFLDTNVTAITITPSADTGDGITITGSATVFDYDSDLADDEQLQVGSLWRIKDGVVKILTVSSTSVATADVQTEPDGTAGDLNTGLAAVTDWAEGAFNGYRGFPAVCAFHDGRFYYASTEYEPQKIWGSVLYEYDNFDVGSAGDDEAVVFEIATEERVAIRWMLSGKKALTLGSTGGTFSAYGTANAPITPSDIQVNRDTNYGSTLQPAKRISSFSYYIQRNLHKIRELSYYYDYDVTRATDMTMLAEHILREGNGVVDWDYQQSPNDRLWCVRSDGEIAVMTRNPEQEVMGWARIIAGTDSTEEGKFESVCVIPKQEADDQVWVVVRRMIDGVEKRFIEYFTMEHFTDVWDAVCLDSSLTLDNPITVTGATSAEPVVITAVGHGLSNGDQVRIDGIVGMTELNGQEFLIANKGDDTFELTDLEGVDIDGSEYSDYISGGEVRLMVISVSGLGHLEGETVQVQMDGDVPTSNSFTVAAGAITLPEKAAVVHAGLPYIPLMKTLRPEGGSQIGTSQGKKKRIPKIRARFYKTLACQVGTEDKQDRITFDELFTGDKTLPVPGQWDDDGRLVVTSDKPLPLTLISLQPSINVSDF